jgi:hypothetical protein
MVHLNFLLVDERIEVRANKCGSGSMTLRTYGSGFGTLPVVKKII